MTYPHILARAMTTQRLRHVKGEIRALGVAAGRVDDATVVVGAVYRGSLWLDGVLKATTRAADLTDAIVDMIRASPHFGQIRVVLIDGEGMPRGSVVSMERLYTGTGKPAIILHPRGGDARFTWRRGGDAVDFGAVGVSRWTAEEVLKTTSTDGLVPEALRVAHMVLSAAAAIEHA